MDWLSRVIRVVWWVSAGWLVLAFLWIGWWFVKYLTDADNPSRYEHGIGAVIIAFYSWPAALGALVAALVPRTGLSKRRRVIGLALLLSCIALLLLFQ